MPIVQQNLTALMNNLNGSNKLTITASVTTLTSHYDDPEQDTMTSSCHFYYIKPNKSLESTGYAQPSLVYHHQILPSGSFDVFARL